MKCYHLNFLSPTEKSPLSLCTEGTTFSYELQLDEKPSVLWHIYA